MLAKKYRITKKRDFDRLYKKGKAIQADIISLKYLENNQPINRFGLIVANKVAKKAYQRNKIKRQIRHILRDYLSPPANKPAYDVLVIAKPKIIEADYSKIKQTLDKSIKLIKGNV